MKGILFVLISFIFFACSKNNGGGGIQPSAQDSLGTGWKKISLPITTAVDVFFVDNLTGFLIGGNSICRSTSGGNSWEKIYQSSGSFINIAMGSSTNAIFVVGGNPSKIVYTTTGGVTFDSVTIADNGLTDAFFVSTSVAYAVGQKCWKTTDGGHSWTSLYDFGVSAFHYKSLYFINEQTGWCVTGDGVFKTTNGGVNWTPLPTTAFYFGNSGSIFFLDASTGFLSDNTSVAKSNSGGAAWTKVCNLRAGYHDIHFLSSTTGYLADYEYVVKTADGGASWANEVKLGNDQIVELHFTDANHGWATLISGHILKYEK